MTLPIGAFCRSKLVSYSQLRQVTGGRTAGSVAVPDDTTHSALEESVRCKGRLSSPASGAREEPNWSNLWSHASRVPIRAVDRGAGRRKRNATRRTSDVTWFGSNQPHDGAQEGRTTPCEEAQVVRSQAAQHSGQSLRPREQLPACELTRFLSSPSHSSASPPSFPSSRSAHQVLLAPRRLRRDLRLGRRMSRARRKWSSWVSRGLSPLGREALTSLQKLRRSQWIRDYGWIASGLQTGCVSSWQRRRGTS